MPEQPEKLSAAQRSRIRRLSMPKELSPDEEGGELNIIPFLDIITNVLMFVTPSGPKSSSRLGEFSQWSLPFEMSWCPIMVGMLSSPHGRRLGEFFFGATGDGAHTTGPD